MGKGPSINDVTKFVRFADPSYPLCNTKMTFLLPTSYIKCHKSVKTLPDYFCDVIYKCSRSKRR